MWLDVFNEMRKKAGMSLDEISAKSGVPKGTLSKITAGITKAPPLETMRKLVYSMGYTLDDLDRGLEVSENFSKDEKAHIKKYRLLDPYGKEAVDGVLNAEYKRYEEKQAAQRVALQSQKAEIEVGEEVAVFILPYYLHPSSAGTGEYSDGDEFEELAMKKRPPRGASYVVRVHGDSMEPTYYDGDKVFVRAGAEVRQGQIGIFVMDGEQYIKELGDRELISHNPAPEYAPRRMTEGTRCQGLVLGVCDESYFE